MVGETDPIFTLEAVPTTGAVVSTIVTFEVVVETFPESSVAVQTTGVTPRGKLFGK